MSDRETVDFLAGVPLLAGREEEDLEALARVVRRRTVQEGETLWQQGGEGRELRLRRRRRAHGVSPPAWRSHGGGRTAGRGETVGEIALLDGNGHTMGVHVTETANGARARPAGVRGTARPPGSVGVQAQAQSGLALHVAPPQPARERRAVARRRRGGPACRRCRADVRRAELLRPARQQVRAPHGDLPRLRCACALGLPHVGAVCRVPARGARCSPKGRRRRPAT